MGKNRGDNMEKPKMKISSKYIVFIIVYAVSAIALIITTVIGWTPVFSFLFLLFSAGFGFASLRLSNKEKLKRCTEYACGKIIRVEKAITKTINHSYFPVVKYVVNGKTYINTYDIGRSSFNYRVGDDFNLLYNPDDPNEITQEDEDLDRASKWYGIASAGFMLLIILMCLWSIGYEYYMNAGM